MTVVIVWRIAVSVEVISFASISPFVSRNLFFHFSPPFLGASFFLPPAVA